MLKIPSFVPFLKSSISILVGIAAFTLVTGGFYFVESNFRIKDFVIQNNPNNMPIAGIPSIEGRYLFLTSEEEIADIISRTNPAIKSVVVSKQYPDTIKLSLTRYEPAAYLKSNDGYFLLAEEATILGKSREIGKPGLPIITYYQSVPFSLYQAGARLPSQDIRDSIYFSGRLRALGIAINSIDIAGFHMLGLYTEEKKYFFSSEKERGIQIYHLEQAIKRFKTEENEYKTIDVRFEKPVITF